MPIANSISVAAGGIAVTGYLTNFVGVEDDTFFVGGMSAPIASFESTSQLTLKVPLSDEAIVEDVAWAITRTGPYWSAATSVFNKVTELIRKIDGGLPITINGAGTLISRAALDGAPEGVTFLQTDVEPFLLYVKLSLAAGDWSPGQRLRADPAQSTLEAQQAAGAAYASATDAAESEGLSAAYTIAASESAIDAEAFANAAGVFADSAADNSAIIQALLNEPLDDGDQADPDGSIFADDGMQET